MICWRSEQAFETVGEMFERITQFRRMLESRLRNTVKYAEQGERGLGSRSRDLVRRIESLLAEDPASYETPTVPVAIEPVMSPWSPTLLTTPRQVAGPVPARALAERPFDPVYLARKRLKADYLDRINPGVDRITAFLRRKVPPYAVREARFITNRRYRRVPGVRGRTPLRLRQSHAGRASRVVRPRSGAGRIETRQRLAGMSQFRHSAQPTGESAMLAEFDEIEARYGAEKAADLRKACRYLIRHQFAYSGDRGVATIYNTLTDNRFRGAVDGLFDSLGYRVLRNAEEQWVGILFDDDDAASFPKLRLDETIVLLVTAGHWQDDADRGDLFDRATSMTTVNVLYERYKDLLQSASSADATHRPLSRSVART